MQTIAIVGAGFSGVALAWNLLQKLPAGSRLILCSNEAAIGRGLAYGTPSPHHLLNVPAARMGISSADEADFLRFLQQMGLPFQAADFVPRNLYSAYLQSVLGEQRAQASARQIAFEICYDEVQALEPLPTAGRSSAIKLKLAQQAPILADKVVLALGNFAPRALAYEAAAELQAQAQASLIQSPWNFFAFASVPVSARVLLLGSGLTAVDVLLQLRHLGHRGPVVMLSRRGLLAQSHRPHGAPVDSSCLAEFVAGIQQQAGLAQRLRYFRRNQAHFAQALPPLDWRDMLAALRPVSATLWQSLGGSGQQQFLRHLQALWDSHRHRMAAPVAARLQQEIKQQRLQLRAGRLLSLHYQNAAEPGAALWRVTWRARGGSSTQTDDFDWVINCTGPVSDLHLQNQGLIAQLYRQGAICADAAHLGLLVQADYQVQAATPERAIAGLYYLGPLLKAQFWEATAVPELRQHAANLAEQLVYSLQRDGEMI